MNITLASLLTVLCMSAVDSNECKQTITQCIDKHLQLEYYQQYKPQIAKAKVVLACAKMSGYLR